MAINNSIKEYISFTEILHHYNIPYCMDSGVLLALMREGKIFDREKDVDLQMWNVHINKFIDIIPKLTEYGWKITIWKYRGLIYQFRVQRKGYIPVHIMVFRKEGDWAWCPAGKGKGSPFNLKLVRFLYAVFVKARRRMRTYLTSTDVAYWPWKVRRDLGTWWVPSHFFEQTIFNEEHKTFIPKEWDNYLSFRYGEWKAPAENWDFWYDDAAIKHSPPECVVDLDKYEV